ncbi:MAG: hypothetical protein A4E45_02328 [Methanosaeta sp. PtaB.Bin039]|nr:MAG: hypothetical protein A4E45_02328 [Methanosaeta sp. PtaB.Bin039]
MYQGTDGETLERAMQILVALGDIYGADRLVQVRSVQIAGVSFKNIGEAGLEWISSLQGQVAVPSILNPAGMDLCRWREMGIEEEFAVQQFRVVEAYRRLGVSVECTCTPYQLYASLAGQGDHLAWSESSAVAYANSVIGARTNREGGPSALAAALVGKTALYGYHLDQNRVPTHSICVEADLLEAADYGALGFSAGRAVGGGVPIFSLNCQPSPDHLKALGAALAASGSVALYYVEGADLKPPWRDREEDIIITKEDIQHVYQEHPAQGADLIALGCPHCSEAELEQIAGLLEGQRVRTDLWICTARGIAERRPDLVRRIEATGARVLCDTCMVVSPATERYRRVLVNSGKALAYLPGLCGTQAAFGNIECCIRHAVGGS